VHEVLDGIEGLEIEFTEQVVGNRSPLRSDLMEAISGWVGENDPGARAVPVVLPAFTDSRWFRAAFPDCVAYGFFPHRHQTLYETWPLIHGADERIDVRDLGFATRFFHELPGRLLH
jgi:acetylornithine deacetylase/succinyl-diaminopimelate desuccinylase-like protein